MRNGALNLLNLMRLVTVLCGAALLGAGISLFITPGGLVPGGVNGIAIILSRLTGVKVGLLSFIINIPLMIIAYKKFGKGFFYNTVFALAACSSFIDYFSGFTPVTDDIAACAMAGGAITALGIGIVLRSGSTTGGADIIVKLIKKRWQYLKTGAVFMVLDGLVAFTSGVVFGSWRNVIYSLLTISISAAMLNLVLYGADEAKLLFVVCNNQQAVKEALIDGLGVGVSLINASGGYTGDSRSIIMCAVRKQSLHKAKQLIYSNDSSAFMIVSSASAIYGKGFKSYEDSEV